MMKKVFILSAVMAAFLFSCKNSTEKIANTTEDNVKEDIKNLKDSLNVLNEELATERLFSLKSNDDGLYFFSKIGVNNPEDFIISELMKTNVTKDKKHPLISFDPRGNRKFQINSVRILNHKWLICDYSDGLDWGEVLMAYYISDDNKSVEFKPYDATLYIGDGVPSQE